MFKIFKKHFTKWYYNKGYTIIGIPGSPMFGYKCPNWVKFFARWLFSYNDYIWLRIENLQEKCDG